MASERAIPTVSGNIYSKVYNRKIEWLKVVRSRKKNVQVDALKLLGKPSKCYCAGINFAVENKSRLNSGCHSRHGRIPTFLRILCVHDVSRRYEKSLIQRSVELRSSSPNPSYVPNLRTSPSGSWGKIEILHVKKTVTHNIQRDLKLDSTLKPPFL